MGTQALVMPVEMSEVDVSPARRAPIKKLPLSQKLMVGGIAGLVGASCTFPIDIVKTRLQSQVPSATGVLPYTGPVHCLRTIVAQSGVRGLYQGLPPTLVGILPEKAIKLAVNDYLCERFEDPAATGGHLSIGKQVVAAAGAGACQVVATTPYEIVKIRMQTQYSLPGPSRQSMMEIVRHLGLRGLYRGTTSTLLRDVPYGVVFFPMYATLKEAATDPESGDLPLLAIVASGAAAGATAAAVVTPADVLKTRLQMRGARFTGLADVYRHVVRNEGHGALFKGMGPRMMVQAPLFGIMLVAFELQKKYMAT